MLFCEARGFSSVGTKVVEGFFLGVIEGNVDFIISGCLVGVTVLRLTVGNRFISSENGFLATVSSPAPEEGYAESALVGVWLARSLYVCKGVVLFDIGFNSSGFVAASTVEILAGALGVNLMTSVGSGVTTGLGNNVSRFDTGSANECVFNFVGVSLVLSAVKI